MVEIIAAHAQDGSRAAAPAWAASAGLVSSKTSRHDLPSINIAPSAVAERRVKRLKRSVWASGHLHGMCSKGFRPPVVWFVTLTYDIKGTLGHGEHDWKPDDVSSAIDKYRKWCRSIGVPCRYTWVAEIQTERAKRTGQHVVHYHMLAWLPEGVNMPRWDRPYQLASGATRSPMWPYGMTNTQKSTAGVGYLMKYLSKLGELTRFPKGLRLYGIGGLDHQARAVRSWFNLPTWAKAEYGVGQLTRKACGLVVRATGEVLLPAFSIIKSPSSLLLVQLRPVVPRWFDGAYSSYKP